ncbi:MAG: hypothetical protein A2152_00705 [Candidatus Levybacteria bacterium RBG_16_35_6]|nr:MAG: hypothetical protein A2152_00705 [Candidatus Levybacteria bacterium RBG_16_35_6]
MAANGKRREFDKRKIVLLSIVLLMVIIFVLIGSSRIDKDTLSNVSKKEVVGVSTKTVDPVKEIKGAVSEQIETIQEEAKNIDLAEVASSSPQVQKIINDIKSIENYPSDKAKSLCEQVCSGL